MAVGPVLRAGPGDGPAGEHALPAAAHLLPIVLDPTVVWTAAAPVEPCLPMPAAVARRCCSISGPAGGIGTKA